VGKPEGRRPLGRPRHQSEDNIQLDLKRNGMGYGLNRSCSGQVHVVGNCECGNESSVSIKCGECLE
jgi:hypothetical protein